MKTATSLLIANRKTLLVTAIAAILVTACASGPVVPEGATAARGKLIALQADPNLATRAPVAIEQAELAVKTAEQPESDKALAANRVYLADRKVDIARAQAETRYAEDQRATLTAQRETARLDSRTHEADAAKAATAVARSDATAANAAAADANAATAAAREETAELQRQIDSLQAKVTDRGLVLTLGDVLFATGSAELKPGAASNLEQLVSFLGKYPSRTVMIEGHTDSVGSSESNQLLSQHRADSVRSHLVRQGIDAARLTTMGAGESTPVAGNDSALGRQQNRRVEVIISNPALAAR
jgi:outer membrane protein OmpA-like peptidoglycan-associated protein